MSERVRFLREPATTWSRLGSLRLRARAVAEGVWAGAHKSRRRGAGIEFGEKRSYAPGDDLRWLDRRSLLLFDKLVVRQFETETDRALRLVVDATASMGFSGISAGSPSRASKYEAAATVAAVLARLALKGGDPFGMALFGGKNAREAAPRGVQNLPVRAGKEGWERLVDLLEETTPAGDAVADPTLAEQAFGILLRGARRGSLVVVISDLLDRDEAQEKLLFGLASRGRVLVVLRLLDRDERTFPFTDATELRGLEGDLVRTADPSVAAAYQQALADDEARLRQEIEARGGRLVVRSTDDDPIEIVRAVLNAAWHEVG